MKAIWYCQKGEWGNEIDVVRRMGRWWDEEKKEVSQGRKLHSSCFMLKWHSSFNTIWRRSFFCLVFIFLKRAGSTLLHVWSSRRNVSLAGTHISKWEKKLTSWVWIVPVRSSGRSWWASAECLQISLLLESNRQLILAAHVLRVCWRNES